MKEEAWGDRVEIKKMPPRPLKDTSFKVWEKVATGIGDPEKVDEKHPRASVDSPEPQWLKLAKAQSALVLILEKAFDPSIPDNEFRKYVIRLAKEIEEALSQGKR